MDMTIENILEAQSYVAYRKTWHETKQREDAYAHNMAGSTWGTGWSEDDTVAALKDYIGGARVQEFNTNHIHRMLDAVEKLPGYASEMRGVGVSTYQQNIDDKWANTYFSTVAFVWYTPEGEFYSGQIKHDVRILAAHYQNADTALEVFIQALIMENKAKQADRNKTLKHINDHLIKDGREPYAHWVDLEFVGRKHGIPEH